ncbi:MAG: ribonuclease HI [Candidatus Baldrarchaeia archaeon]
MGEVERTPENPYARGPLVSRTKGPIFTIHDQDDVPLDCKDSSFLHVWCDGGGNCGPTSLGVVVIDEGILTMTLGMFLGDNLTNNIAELQAIWKGLRLVKHLWRPVRIYSDSEYSLNSICGIYRGQKNRDIIDPMIEYIKQYPLLVEFVKVAGHAGLPYNEMADGIATMLLQQGKDKNHPPKKKKKQKKSSPSDNPPQGIISNDGSEGT